MSHNCLGKNLDLWYRNPEWAEGRFEQADFSIKDILNGTFDIIKLPKIIKLTETEQIAIDYAKACGCKYLAKDRYGNVRGFSIKPLKDKEDGWWILSNPIDGRGIELHLPISFLVWEDENPYYIGGDK